MSQAFQPYSPPKSAVSAAVDSRARFIVRTYNHLFGAIVLFTLLEIALFKSGLADVIAPALLGSSWLLVLGGFMIVSWLASRVAHTADALIAQSCLDQFAPLVTRDRDFRHFAQAAGLQLF